MTSGTPDDESITGHAIHTVTFAQAQARTHGYDTAEVDAFLDRCANGVDRLRSELAEALGEVDRLRAQIERDSRSGEVEQAISVLTTAQQTADRTVADADEYSRRVMAEAQSAYEDARRNAAVLEEEAEAKAQAVYQDALHRAAAIDRENSDLVALLEQNAASTRQELEQQTMYLKTLRDSTRTQMESFLEGLLDHLAVEYGKADPAAAQAAQSASAGARSGQRRARRRSGAERAALARTANGQAGRPVPDGRPSPASRPGPASGAPAVPAVRPALPRQPGPIDPYGV